VANGASAVTGAGDPFCPSTNRPGHPSPDSTRFAPIVPGDSLSATGNFERVGGVQFLSAHTVKVLADVTTQNLAAQPDYVIFNEVEWDAPPYPGSRVGARFLGATSLHDSRVDIFSVHYDNANVPHEIPLETTANNANNGPVLFAGLPTGAFDIALNVDFLEPVVGLEPCPDLVRGDLPGISAFCSNPSTLSQNFRLMSPIAREVVGRTRHKATLNAGVVTRDIRGNLAPNGQYLTPVGIEYPGMGGIDLGRLQSPFSFSGVPWNLDRRLSPGGCVGPCEGTPQPLSPFPFEGIDPRTQSLRAPVPSANRILSYYPFGPSNVLAWPPADPAPIGITPIEPLALVCSLFPSGATLSAIPADGATAGVVVTFTGSAVGGTGPYEYEFQARLAGGSFAVSQPFSSSNRWTWDTTGSLAGSYEVRVNVRSAGSTAPFEARTTIPYTLSMGATLTPSPAGPRVPGTPVTWTASASGGSGGYEYQIWFWNGSWSIVKDYNVVGDRWNWNTTGLADGTYYVLVYARNAGSASDVEAVAFTPYNLATPQPATGATLTPSPAGPRAPGTPVTWTTSASGGSGSYEYQIWFHNGSWSIVKDYNVAGDRWDWNTTGLTDGTYYVLVYARSAGSTSDVEAVALTPYNLVTPSVIPPATGATLTPSPSTQPPGTRNPVTWTASASGGSGSYEYQIWFHNGSWSIVKDYGVPGDSWNWNTAGLANGRYYVLVYARSAGSTSDVEAVALTPYELQ